MDGWVGGYSKIPKLLGQVGQSHNIISLLLSQPEC